MSGSVVYSDYPEILRRIDGVRTRRGRVWCVEHALFYAAVLVSVGLGAVLVNALVPLPSLVRWPMLIGVLAFGVAGFGWYVIAPLFRSWNDEQIAVQVEQRYPEINNGLIGAVQLGVDSLAPSPAMIDRFISDVATRLRTLDLRAAVETRRLTRRLLWSAGVTVALVAFAALWPSGFATGVARLFNPSSYAASVGRVEILQIEPGDAAVVQGQDLPVAVTCAVPLPPRTEASVSIAFEDKTARREEMSPLGEDRFVFTFREIQQPFNYRIRVGRTDSAESYQVRIIQPPAIEQIDLEYHYPQYTGLPPASFEKSAGHVRALLGTEVAATLRFNKPIASGHAMLSTAQRAPLELSADRTSGKATFTVAADGTYTIHLKDDEGVSNRNPVVYTITALPDKAPTVKLVAPGKDVTLAVGETLVLALEATDDYGLTEVGVLFKPVKGEEVSRLTQWTTFTDPLKAGLSHRWTFDAEHFRPGDVLVYSAYATDNNRLAREPSTAKTKNYMVTLIDPNARKSEHEQEIAQWQRKIQAILEMQIAARDKTVPILAVADLDTMKADAAPVRKDQVAIRAETIAVAAKLEISTSAGLARVKDVLFALTGNEMAEAIKLTEGLDARADLVMAKDDLAKLVQTQDKIIELLRKILDVLPNLAAETEQAKKPEEKTSDLPSETQKKLEDIVDGLKDFLKDQKKAIEATSDLAKKPVEDLTEADKEELRELAATEDKWSKFMQEAHSDLSKLPEMDFSNPALLKELTEIYTELQKAKESLTSAATELAVPIEEAGLELAQRLVDNIEKWLPEGADRTKWSMEEPIGDYEIPLADLPKELTDIIGDLMEEEEDLFEEMEDATSAWADSANLVGWDVADGPISNMGANGVTGNQLPNQNEIGGRSGEGRTGKSSGEMVEETATGKGGRDTPTRLTSEPFSKGEIKDTSNDPAGGATGGGKVSGAGGEGLEGPAPPDFKDRFKDLAQRQAQILQTSEKVDLGFKVLNYPSLFAPTRDQMKEVEVDLENARYQNALRKKDIILKGLDASREFLTDNLQIRRDRSVGLPNELQDEIIDAMSGPAPEGYEDLLQKYYEALSKGQ